MTLRGSQIPPEACWLAGDSQRTQILDPGSPDLGTAGRIRPQDLLIAYLGADVRSLARPQNQMRRLRRRAPTAHTDDPGSGLWLWQQPALVASHATPT